MTRKVEKRIYKKVMEKYNKFSDVQDVKRAHEEIDSLIEEDRFEEVFAIYSILSGDYVVYKKEKIEDLLW